MPASLSKAQYKKYARSPAKTDYLEFAGRPHLHMTAPDWEEVAAAIDSWLDGVLDAPVAAKEGASAKGSRTTTRRLRWRLHASCRSTESAGSGSRR